MSAAVAAEKDAGNGTQASPSSSSSGCCYGYCNDPTKCMKIHEKLTMILESAIACPWANRGKWTIAMRTITGSVHGKCLTTCHFAIQFPRESFRRKCTLLYVACRLSAFLPAQTLQAILRANPRAATQENGQIAQEIIPNDAASFENPLPMMALLHRSLSYQPRVSLHHIGPLGEAYPKAYSTAIRIPVVYWDHEDKDDAGDVSLDSYPNLVRHAHGFQILRRRSALLERNPQQPPSFPRAAFRSILKEMKNWTNHLHFQVRAMHLDARANVEFQQHNKQTLQQPPWEFPSEEDERILCKKQLVVSLYGPDVQDAMEITRQQHKEHPCDNCWTIQLGNGDRCHLTYSETTKEDEELLNQVYVHASKSDATKFRIKEYNHSREPTMANRLFDFAAQHSGLEELEVYNRMRKKHLQSKHQDPNLAAALLPISEMTHLRRLTLLGTPFGNAIAEPLIRLLQKTNNLVQLNLGGLNVTCPETIVDITRAAGNNPCLQMFGWDQLNNEACAILLDVLQCGGNASLALVHNDHVGKVHTQKTLRCSPSDVRMNIMLYCALNRIGRSKIKNVACGTPRDLVDALTHVLQPQQNDDDNHDSMGRTYNPLDPKRKGFGTRQCTGLYMLLRDNPALWCGHAAKQQAS